MKKFIVSFILLICIVVSMAHAAPIITDKVILEKKPDTYMEVRHIVIRGTNEEIGKALGDIGQKWLDVKLNPFASPVYAKANRIYMKKNYPGLYERMKGVAKSYGIAPMNNKYVMSSLVYDMAPFGCSTIFFPGNTTTNRHNIIAHSVDFYTTTLREMMGMKHIKGEHPLFSRNFVMELYPDKGYPSIVIGTFDLLNGGLGGMNSKGLMVTMLADNWAPKNTTIQENGVNLSGLSALQLFRLILDSCSNTEEAKIAILNNKIALSFEPFHFQVSDREGNSFIYEMSAKDFSDHFTDNNGKPQVMTNHSVFLYPDVNKLPKIPPKATYNTFSRYRKLHDYITNHKGKFSPVDAIHAMSLVAAHTIDKDEGATYPIPCRTFWRLLYDLDDLTLQVRFYLRDGKKDPKTGDPTLIFTKPYEFKLNVKK